MIASFGGHVAVVLIAGMLAAHRSDVGVAPAAVSVTLVTRSQASQAAPSEPTRLAGFLAKSAPAETTPQSSSPPRPHPRESLDSLFGPSAPSSASRDATDPSASTSAAAHPGSSRADQGLGPDEGTQGVDLYAAASLPSVGTRPAAATGDLWRRVAPCWRPAAPRRATLLVTLLADGGLTGVPQAVRRRDAAVDSQTLLAERAAVRAVQACAPYVGLGGTQWRVEFP
ncbi:hypothetical protein ASD79_22360 [Caulobacter sp. Root655]|nr:hypothetical protein ASD79_22360 [Caulobacter sp. Root655]